MSTLPSVGSSTNLLLKQLVTATENIQGGGGGGGVPTSRTISTTSPLAGGGDLSANRTLSIANAAADGVTKGAAAFLAADFNSASGVISLDYTNGQKASGSQPGFLSSADWTTFNGKQGAITFGTGVQTALGVNIGSAGAPVLFNGAGGVPSSITLTNGTGLPVGGITGLGTGIATFLGIPSSANLAAAVTDETGSGALVFATSPTLVTPTLGVASATSLNTGQGANQLYPMDQAVRTTDVPTFANLVITPTTLTFASTTTIDFSLNGLRTVTLTGDITFATSNLVAGKSVTVRIIGDSSQRSFTFPGSWTFISPIPANIAANKTAVLTLTSFSTTDANVVAAYSVQS